MSTVEVSVAGKRMNLSNLEKVLYPETHFTKGQVIDYYLKMAPTILPHLKNRALTLKRYPGGVEGQFFYEKHCPSHRPDWVQTAAIHSNRNGEAVNYCVVKDRATLAWVANLASLELHTSLAKVKDVGRPTMMAFDLDPGPPADMLDCIRVGKRLRKLLSEMGLESFPKTSGGKGLHIYVPLNTPATFEQTKEFAHNMARLFEHEDPDHVLSMMSRSAREGKVFMDWSQNDQHKTTVCVYSLRARAASERIDAGDVGGVGAGAEERGCVAAGVRGRGGSKAGGKAGRLVRADADVKAKAAEADAGGLGTAHGSGKIEFFVLLNDGLSIDKRRKIGRSSRGKRFWSLS